MIWKKTRVLVTGGASFIGSHLTEKLVSLGAVVRVVDNLSSGKLENIQALVSSGKIEFMRGDLLRRAVVQRALGGIEMVFHLAAVHGGRGFIDTHQAVCSDNLIIDAQLIRFAYKSGIQKLIFASSGCVYPINLQNNRNKIYLKEQIIGPPYNPDNMYGWAKLTTEKILLSYAKDFKLKSATCRLFTVYGPRGKEDHAIISLIARAFIRQNPFEIWGDGQQVRNWTYVSDIVRGMILAAEKIDNGEAVNLGTKEPIKVIEAVCEILNYVKFKPKLKFLLHMPIGPVNRVCDNSRAVRLLDWRPLVKFSQGLRQTMDWYFKNHEQGKVETKLPLLLNER